MGTTSNAMSTPRILIWFWSGGGGGSLFAYNLARRLSLGFGQGAVTLSLRADDPIFERACGSEFSVLAADIVSDRRKPLTTLASLQQGARILAEHARNSDIVIVPMNFASAAPLSAGLKHPLVYCAHDPEPHPGDYARAMQRATQAALVRRAQKVVALSSYAAGRLRALGVSERKLVIAPLQSVFEPAPWRPPSGTCTRTLFAGRMIAYKGVDLLALALDQIAARDDWRLVIAGDGPALDEAVLQRFAKPQIEGIARGWLSDAQLDTMIAEADLLLFPYRSATQSGVLAQGMAMGKPSIVTPVGALPEQIGDGGWVAEGANAQAFARSLLAALDSPEARFAAATAAHLRARSAWERDAWGWLANV